MGKDREVLGAHVSGLLQWEKRKRCERTLVAALSGALLAALAAPLFVSIPHDWAWTTPLAFLVLIAPPLLLARRWRRRDTARSLAALDRALGLGERVTTAWELVQRNDTRAVALLVLRQAAERVKGADPRKLFPRRWDKRVFLVVPLFALWLALHLFEVRFAHDTPAPGEPPAAARELRDFARRLEEKARSEGLPRALEAARELERIAQRGIDARTGDNAFRREIAGAQRKMAADGDAAAQTAFGAAESQRQLEDLKAELETAREWLATPGSESQSWASRLAGLTQLRKHGQWRPDESGQTLNRDELGAFLDKLDKRVAAELDRRALLDAERYLNRLAQGGQGKDGDRRAGLGSTGKREGKRSGEREDSLAGVPEGQASAPGTKPGTATGDQSRLPEYRVGVRSPVPGERAEGERSVIFLKGRPTAGTSAVSEDEVIAAYRRQAEAELDTERIPGELKDAIRTYFLSLEESK